MRGMVGLALAALVACASDVEPAFEVGFVTSDEFSPLTLGDACPVVDAVQGGYWVMPTLRVRGVGEVAFVECQMTEALTDRELGHNFGDRRFEDAGYDWKDHRFLLNLSEVRSPDQFTALDGVAARLSCSVADGDLSQTFETQITLEPVVF